MRACACVLARVLESARECTCGKRSISGQVPLQLKDIHHRFPCSSRWNASRAPYADSRRLCPPCFFPSMSERGWRDAASRARSISGCASCRGGVLESGMWKGLSMRQRSWKRHASWRWRGPSHGVAPCITSRCHVCSGKAACMPCSMILCVSQPDAVALGMRRVSVRNTAVQGWVRNTAVPHRKCAQKLSFRSVSCAT